MSSKEEIKKKWKEKKYVDVSDNFQKTIEKAEREKSLQHYPSEKKEITDSSQTRNRIFTQPEESNNMWSRVLNTANNIIQQTSSSSNFRFYNQQISQMKSKEQQFNILIDKKIDRNSLNSKNLINIHKYNSFDPVLSAYGDKNPKEETNKELLPGDFRNPKNLIVSDGKNTFKTMTDAKKAEERQKNQEHYYKTLQTTQQGVKESAEKNNAKMKNGNILEKAGATTSNIGAGFVTGATTGFADPVMSTYSFVNNVADDLGIKRRDAIYPGSNLTHKDITNAYKDMKNTYQSYGSYLDNDFSKTTYDVSNTIGNMLPAFVTGVTGEALGLSTGAIEATRKFTSALTSGSSEYLDSLNEEQDNYLKSAIKGGLYGLATYKIEGITGGNFISKNGSLDKLAVKNISRLKSEFGKKVFSFLYNIGGEYTEEEVENVVDHIIDYAFGEKEGLTAKELFEEAKQTFKTTSITNTVLNLLGLGGGTYNDVKMYEANQKIDNSNLNIDEKAAMKELVEENNNPYIADYLLSKHENSNTNNNTQKLSNDSINLIQNSKLSDEGKEKLSKIAEKYNLSETDIKKAIEKTLNGKYNQNQQTRIENNQLLNNNQQITQQQNNLSEKAISEQIKKDSENFAKQVDGITKGKLPKKNMLTLLRQTPKALQDIGLPNYPITMTSKHLDTIMNESGNFKGSNYHNLGEDIVKQLPEAIANPLDIVKSNTKDDSVVLTTYLADKNDNTVVASIKIDGKGFVNDIIIDTNVMTSAYGKDNYESFMDRNLKEDNLLYDIDRGVIKRVVNPRLQLSSLNNSSVDTVDNVSTTNNSISQNEKNMQVQDNNIENIGNNVYNSNESESGINGKQQERNLERNISESKIFKKREQQEKEYREWESSITSKEGSEITKESSSNETGENTEIKGGTPSNGTSFSENKEYEKRTKYTRLEYEKFEKSIIESNEISDEYKKIKDNIKQKYNKDIVYFKNNNNKGYSGGASLTDSKKIYLDLNTIEEFGANRVALHEIMESNIRHADNNVSDSIYSAIDDLIQDSTFVKQKEEFLKGQNIETPSDFAIAKDIICDRFAELNGEELDYKNLLSNEMNNRIDMAIEYFNKELGNKSSSFKMPEKKNKEIKLPQNPNRLLTSKRIETNRVELKTDTSIYEDENLRAFKYATDNIDNISQEDNYAPPKPPEGELPDTKSRIKRKRTKEKLKPREVLDSFSQTFVNKGHYIDKLANETGNKELTYKYDRTLSTFNEAQYSIGNEQVNSKGEVVGESLLDIFKPIEKAKLELDFEDYLLNKHNIARTAVGKSIYGDEVSAPQSSKIVENYERKHPEFKEWAEKVNKYNQNTLKDMADTGMISQETYSNLKVLYGDYVPTYRDIVQEKIIVDDTNNNVGKNVLGKATKSNLDILSPKEAMAEQTLAIKKAIRMNELGIELYKTLGKDSTVFEGIDFDASAIQTLGGDVIQKAQDGMNTFTIFIDGKMAQFKISDDLYTAFNKDTIQSRIQNDKVKNALLTPLEKLSKVQRNLLTTYSIGFAINNPIKDIQDAVFNTKYSVARFGKNYVKALYQIGRQGSLYKQYIRDGGSSNTYYEYNKGLLPQKKIIKKVADKIQILNETLEMAPRLAEYMSTIEKGGTKSEALYNAAEITTNFKRGGDITKAANKYGANFLNASVQGLDKQIRNITGQNGIKGYASLVTRTALLGVLPSALNHLLLDDDEDYQDLPDYIKDSYYIMPAEKELPKTLEKILGENYDGKFYRIPKGRVLATIGTVARNMLEFAEGERSIDKAITGSLSGITNNMAPNNPLTENLISPIVQASRNKAWYDGDIESSRLQKLPVAERTDEKTDKLSNKISEALQSNTLTKYIADNLGISPKKINYVIDQYSGGVGDVLLPMATPYAETNIIEDKFTTSSILKNKNVENFYIALENSELSKNSEFATDTDKLQYKYLNEISKDIGDLYAEKRDIQNSNLSNKEKRDKCKNIQAKINDIAKNALKTLEEAKITNTTASFNGTQYYKDEEENWKEIDNDDIPSGLSVDTYGDYKNKLAIETDKKRKEKNDDDINLTSKEKANILKRSSYTDKEKKKIYSEILGKKDDDYKYLSKLENININAYLDYKIQEIKGDEDSSSDIVGKTKSGSKKNNLIRYLNSSELSNLDKIYILGKSNKLTTEQGTILENIVNNSSLTSDEKKEFYKGLASSNVEELKNGNLRIKWRK